MAKPMAPYPRSMLILAIVGAVGMWGFCLACLAFTGYCARVLWSGRVAKTLKDLKIVSKEESEWGARIFVLAYGAFALYVGILGLRTMIQTM